MLQSRPLGRWRFPGLFPVTCLTGAQWCAKCKFGILRHYGIPILENLTQPKIPKNQLWIPLVEMGFKNAARITTRPLDLAGTRLAPRVFHRARRASSGLAVHEAKKVLMDAGASAERGRCDEVCH